MKYTFVPAFASGFEEDVYSLCWHICVDYSHCLYSRTNCIHWVICIQYLPIADDQLLDCLQDIKADPWFQQDLPPTVNGYNERLCSVDENEMVSIRKLQSEREIESLVHRAITKT